MRPYGVISDTHHHAWSAFATALESGINSRLHQILAETARCAKAVRAAGGDTIYHGGDLFHVRGSIAPSVLNPTLDLYRALIADGMKIVINAGNHDLEGKEASRLSSAITALEGVGCHVVNAPNYGSFDDMVIIPWIADIAQLKTAIENVDPADRGRCDLLLHAPIDGVIPGLPDHGLTAEYLASLGYRRVFAGHYHHHKDFGNGVYSIGALTHQTWSDIGAKAGFLIVNDLSVHWHASHAPSFIELDRSVDPADYPLLADGNYVRVKVENASLADVEQLRSYLTNDCGAKGVTVLMVKTGAVAARSGSTVKAGATLAQSVNDFIGAQGFKRPADVATLCADILTTVRSVG